MEGRPRHGQEVDSYLYFTPSRPVRKQLKVEEIRLSSQVNQANFFLFFVAMSPGFEEKISYRPGQHTYQGLRHALL